MKRLFLLVAAAGALGAGAALPAHASGGDWVCVYSRYVSLGYCQQNPLPSQLPASTTAVRT